MNYYGAREIEKDGKGTGRWHYTVKNDGIIRPLGYCAPYVSCPYCRGRGILLGGVQCESCAGKGYKKQMEPCQGHASQEEAEAHQNQFVLDQAVWEVFQFDKHHPHFCEVCDEESIGAFILTTPHQGDRRYFCLEHSTKEVLAGKLTTSVVISSD